MGCRPVLVVDDDEDLRNSACDVLETAGYRTIQADNGRTALEFLSHASEDQLPGCIIIDLMMPEMDGSTFIQKLVNLDKPCFKQINLMIWTARGKIDRAELELPERVETLRKPIEMDELLDAVERHCGPPRAS